MKPRQQMLLVLIGMGLGVQPFFAETPAGTSLADLNPFTHYSLIPAGVNLKTIRFETVKQTKVFTKVRTSMNTDYCSDLQFRDPGGSMYCPGIQNETRASAYEVTYSYKGEPLPSDEYGNRYFTFQVYFRPDELPSGLRRALASGKVSRAELATYFQMTASSPFVRKTVIDDAKSSFCDGNYVDGAWVRYDRSCRDKVSLKTVTAPSGYLKVQVEPVSSITREAASRR